ncbi:hypothetical protein ABZ805_15760 [Saccharopolyspora sp. NPDC047091]|uniref:hypothetical protein n=1 Tax=Saccharopolyspora sp. NPDC047091 TaxID=3155924 RepID=UPI0033F95A4D
MAAWIEQWLSAPRLAPYRAAASTERAALELYEWNATISAAFHHDIAHLEVGLRNAHDRSLCADLEAGEPHWTATPARFFPPARHRAANGRLVDTNDTARATIAKARGQAARGLPRGTEPPPGKVIAELSFGFWRFLTSRRHHDRLWIPLLHRAFPRGTARADLDRPLGRLHGLRNRAAHHENLLRANLPARHQDVLDVAALLAPELATHLKATSTVPALLGERPR